MGAAKVDRSKWAAGPWDSESDREEWRSPVGQPCLAVRNHLGAWCGYVAVPPGHRYHKVDYGDIDVECHGGLTFSAECGGGVCHVPSPGEPDDVWWLGFDCAHCWDIVPSMGGLHGERLYRDVAYVRAEVERLAAQLV